jgi:hypothetical protein
MGAASHAARAPVWIRGLSPRTLGVFALLGLVVAFSLSSTLVIGRGFARPWFAILGGTAAALVAAGVVSPLGLPLVDEANFVGYVLYSVWLVAFGVVLLARERRVRSTGRAPAGVLVAREES